MGFQVGAKEVIMLLAFAVQVIAAGAYFNCYYPTGKIYAGKGIVNWARAWYFSYSVFCFGLISILFAIAELGLAFFPQYFSFVDSMVLRCIVYILKGIATLGVSGDLGIAAGALELAIGAVMLIYSLVQGGKFGCKK